MKENKVKWIIFAIFFIFVFALYLYNISPTVAFWDCGQFLACSYILGIPHPPGTPLYVLIGRIFSLIPFSPEIALRINILSALSGALSAAFVYLLVQYVIKEYQGFEFVKKYKFVPYIAGIIGGIFTAFARTVWENSLEAEVYIPSAAIGLVMVWIALKWREREKQGSPRPELLLLLVYTLFLSAGLHLTPVMTLFAVIPFLMVVRGRMLPPFFLAVILLLFILFVPNLWVHGVVTLGFIIYLVYLHYEHKLDLKFLGLGTLLLLIAFSVQLYLIIRAHGYPAINMVEPTNWQRFISILRREQYGIAEIGSQLFPRKTVVDPETGQPTGIGGIAGVFWQIWLYIRYFFWQWGLEIHPLTMNFSGVIALIPTALGIYGMHSLYKRERKIFMLLGFLFLIASLGAVAYLNLRFSPSDPNPLHQPREVRERDYFFGFSFVVYGIFIGLGTGELFHQIFKKQRNLFKTNALLGASTLGIISLLPMIYNWNKVTRRHDWIPAEYGYNILASCEEPSVVFTNGDNDTFPVWFVQEVPSTMYGNKPYKPKVINANLSLLNTHWYIAQLKRKGAPISFSYEEIENLPPYIITPERKIIYLRDIIIRDLIATNAGIYYTDRDKGRVGNFTPIPLDYLAPDSIFWEKVMKNYKEGKMPIYFSNTVERKVLNSYLPYLTMEGIVYRVRGPEGEPINLEKSLQLFNQKFKMSSMFDPRVRKDENTRGLFINYGATIIQLAAYLLEHNRLEEGYKLAKELLKFEVGPEEKQFFYYNLSQFAMEVGKYKEALELLDTIEKLGPQDPQLYVLRGVIYFDIGEYNLAKREIVRYSAMVREKPVHLIRMFFRYLHKKDLVGAVNFLKLWDEALPGNHYTWLLYLRNLHDTAKAIEALKKIPDKMRVEQQMLDSLLKLYKKKV